MKCRIIFYTICIILYTKVNTIFLISNKFFDKSSMYLYAILDLFLFFVIRWFAIDLSYGIAIFSGGI